MVESLPRIGFDYYTLVQLPTFSCFLLLSEKINEIHEEKLKDKTEILYIISPPEKPPKLITRVNKWMSTLERYTILPFSYMKCVYITKEGEGRGEEEGEIYNCKRYTELNRLPCNHLYWFHFRYVYKRIKPNRKTYGYYKVFLLYGFHRRLGSSYTSEHLGSGRLDVCLVTVLVYER